MSNQIAMSTESEDLRAKRFCLLTLSLCVIAFLLAAVTNFVVNPYAQYGTDLVPPLVQTSRSQKLELVQQMQPMPTGLILGSSRVLKLEPDYLNHKTGLRFFNAGVNYGKPEDFLAFLRLYQQQYGKAPEMVLLGMDVHGFSDAIPTDARLLSNAPLASQVSDIIPFADRFHRWKELLSWQQTTMSMKSILRTFKRPSDEPAIESFRDDGLIVYHQREQQLRDGVYDFDAALDYNRNEYRQLFHGYEKLSYKRREAFHKLASICGQNGTRLVVFLTPFHPELRKHLATGVYPDRREDVIAFLSRQATTHQFTFVDLTDLASFEGNAEFFVDGIHPLEKNTRRMIDSCLAARAESVQKRREVAHAVQ